VYDVPNSVSLGCYKLRKILSDSYRVLDDQKPQLKILRKEVIQ